MKLCLINPPEIDGFVSDRDKAGGIGVARPVENGWRARYLPPTPPLDLLYAASIAERDGVPLAFVDAIGKRWGADQVLREAQAAAPTHLGVRITLPSLDDDLALANRLVQALPDTKVFLFGHASQTTWRAWLDRFMGDAVFFGEVEAILPKYLAGEAEALVLRPGRPQAGCDPVWTYVDDAEMERLPYPAWHRIDIPAYSPTGKVEDFVFYILTSRGCPKGCSMCPYYVHQGKAWRHRTPDDVVAELAHLKKIGARYVQTRDPNISWRKPHLMAIAERLKGERQLRITTETDLEVLSEADLVALKEAGFVRIMTGVESVDEAILKEIHQNGNALRRSLENMTKCEALGIEVTGFFIVGSLTETWKTVRDTVATAKALPCQYSVSLMTPYFGTQMRDAYIAAGYLRESPFRRYNGYTGMIRTKGLSFEEVTLAHAWAAAELELVTRERQLAKTNGVARLVLELRVARQRARVAALRLRADAAARRAPAQDAEPTSAAA